MEDKIKVSMAKMETNLVFIKKELIEIKDAVKACNKKFASKWVETAMAGLIVIFVLATLYTIFDKVGLPR